MNHNPNCDVNDRGPDGIKKPCNCTKPSTCGSICMEEFMTPEAQRIAIAESCGWKFYCVNYFGDRVYHDPSGVVATDNPADKDHVLPYYLSDLNAMHEAEAILDAMSIDDQYRYWEHLSVTLMPVGFPEDDVCLRGYATLRATAAQRAEAFLKTIGGWVDEL